MTSILWENPKIGTSIPTRPAKAVLIIVMMHFGVGNKGGPCTIGSGKTLTQPVATCAPGEGGVSRSKRVPETLRTLFYSGRVANAPCLNLSAQPFSRLFRFNPHTPMTARQPLARLTGNGKLAVWSLICLEEMG